MENKDYDQLYQQIEKFVKHLQDLQSVRSIEERKKQLQEVLTDDFLSGWFKGSDIYDMYSKENIYNKIGEAFSISKSFEELRNCYRLHVKKEKNTTKAIQKLNKFFEHYASQGIEVNETTIRELAEGSSQDIQKLQQTIDNNVNMLQQKGHGVDIVAFAGIVSDKLPDIIDVLEQSGVHPNERCAMTAHLIEVDIKKIHDILQIRPSIEHEDQIHSYKSEEVCMFGGAWNDMEQVSYKIKEKLDVHITVVYKIRKLRTAYRTKNWKKNLDFAKDTNCIKSIQMSDELRHNINIAALKTILHDDFVDCVTMCRNIGITDKDMPILMNFLSRTGDIYSQGKKISVLIYDLGMIDKKRIIKAMGDICTMNDPIEGFLLCSDIEDVKTQINALKHAGLAKEEIILLGNILTSANAENLQYILTNISAKRDHIMKIESILEGANIENLKIANDNLLQGLNTESKIKTLSNRSDILTSANAENLQYILTNISAKRDHIMKLKSILEGANIENLKIANDNLLQGLNIESKIKTLSNRSDILTSARPKNFKLVFTANIKTLPDSIALKGVLEKHNPESLSLLIENLQRTHIASVENIQKYVNYADEDSHRRYRNTKQAYKFRFDTISIKKIAKSKDNRRFLTKYLKNSYEKTSFFNSSQNLIQKAGVGKNHIIQIIKYMNLANALGVDIDNVQITTTDTTQKTLQLMRQLQLAIGDVFNKKFHTQIDKKKIEEIEDLLVPIVTYSNFITSYPNLDIIFTDSVDRFLQGFFFDYKYSQEFKEEVGEEIYNIWSQERSEELVLVDKTTPRQKEQMMLAKFTNNLNQVQTHFSDSSEYTDFLISLLDNPDGKDPIVEDFCKQINEKDIEKISKAAEKYIQSKQLLDDMTIAQIQGNKSIEELNTMIIGFNKLIGSIVSMLKLDGLKPQVQVLNQTFKETKKTTDEYIYYESGSFDELFCAGKVKNESSCQAYDYPAEHKKGLTGYIELPWIKTVTIRKKGSKPPMESEARVTIKLTKDATNDTYKVMIERIYGDNRFLPLIKEKLEEAYKRIEVLYIPKKGAKNIVFLGSGRADDSYSDALGGNQDYRGKIY